MGHWVADLRRPLTPWPLTDVVEFGRMLPRRIAVALRPLYGNWPGFTEVISRRPRHWGDEEAGDAGTETDLGEKKDGTERKQHHRFDWQWHSIPHRITTTHTTKAPKKPANEGSGSKISHVSAACQL
jgi:hypothetical protein